MLEREAAIGTHQTGHNSGVIHAGVYYAPGSLKARLCVEGARELYEYCESRGIASEACGKVIVATGASELARLEELERRGRANGVPGLRRIDARGIEALEPHARGVAGLHSPGTGIVDFGAVARAYARDLLEAGGTVVTGCAVEGMQERGAALRLLARRRRDRGRARDLLRGRLGRPARGRGGRRGRPTDRAVPRRLPAARARAPAARARADLPRPRPLAAVPRRAPHQAHRRRRADRADRAAGGRARRLRARAGTARGPARYARLARVVADVPPVVAHGARRAGPRDAALDARARGGALRAGVASAGCRTGRLSFAGVRAQALGRDGRLIEDFVFSATPRALHVRNAPSPAATSSLAIGRYVAGEAERRFGL